MLWIHLTLSTKHAHMTGDLTRLQQVVEVHHLVELANNFAQMLHQGLAVPNQGLDRIIVNEEDDATIGTGLLRLFLCLGRPLSGAEEIKMGRPKNECWCGRFETLAWLSDKYWSFHAIPSSELSNFNFVGISDPLVWIGLLCMLRAKFKTNLFGQNCDSIKQYQLEVRYHFPTLAASQLLPTTLCEMDGETCPVRQASATSSPLKTPISKGVARANEC